MDQLLKMGKQLISKTGGMRGGGATGGSGGHPNPNVDYGYNYNPNYYQNNANYNGYPPSYYQPTPAAHPHHYNSQPHVNQNQMPNQNGHASILKSFRGHDGEIYKIIILSRRKSFVLTMLLMSLEFELYESKSVWFPIKTSLYDI